jgi:hypothetical protein
VWHPSPGTDGLNAFEGVEDDRAHSDPGVKHIYVKDGGYHWDMPVKERDRQTDRQRNEVRGMRNAGKALVMGQGSTWRLTYDLYLPSSLHGTSEFTHIHQLKKPDTGSLPLVTMSLRRDAGPEVLALYAFAAGVDVAVTPLAPLRDHWVSVDLTYLIGPKGAAHFTLKDNGRTVVQGSRTNIKIWLGDRIWPKWGIYRSVRSAKSDIVKTWMEIRNFKAYTA